MSNVLFIAILTIFASFVFLFFLWKKLREDYERDEIFTLGFASLIGLFVGLLISRLFQNYWFWTGIVGFMLPFSLLHRTFHLRFYESLEAATPGIIVFFSIPFWVDFIYNQQIISVGILVFLMISFCALILLKKHYKRFTWYKSGKIGFASMAVLGFIFLARAIASLLIPSLITVASPLDVVASVIVSFLCFFSLYNLSDI